MSVQNNPVPYPPQGVTEVFSVPYQTNPPQGVEAGGTGGVILGAESWQMEVATVPTNVEMEVSTVPTLVEFLLPQ